MQLSEMHGTFKGLTCSIAENLGVYCNIDVLASIVVVPWFKLVFF